MSDTRPQDQPDEALMDLLVKQVTEGLSPAEQRMLDAMDSERASAALRDLERAAAAVALAAADTGDETLPAALAARIARQAAEHFAAPNSIADFKSARPGAAAVRPLSMPGRAKRFGMHGWLAAAACLVLAIFGWERSPPPPPAAEVVQPPRVTAPPAPPTLAEQRAALLAKADTLKIPLAAGKDPAAAGVSGDVVWDPATQRGFLHFAGLAPNDPAMHQYQLWIFDAGRDKRYPVDGGVFDVPANQSEVIIPIRAALMVRKPAAFAVTLEKPGGVVVSGREHVIALGAAG